MHGLLETNRRPCSGTGRCHTVVSVLSLSSFPYIWRVSLTHDDSVKIRKK